MGAYSRFRAASARVPEELILSVGAAGRQVARMNRGRLANGGGETAVREWIANNWNAAMERRLWLRRRQLVNPSRRESTQWPTFGSSAAPRQGPEDDGRIVRSQCGAWDRDLAIFGRRLAEKAAVGSGLNAPEARPQVANSPRLRGTAGRTGESSRASVDDAFAPTIIVLTSGYLPYGRVHLRSKQELNPRISTLRPSPPAMEPEPPAVYGGERPPTCTASPAPSMGAPSDA